MDDRATTAIERLWGGKSRWFQLNREQLSELELKFGAGPVELSDRIRARVIRVSEIEAVLRLAMIGAGDSDEAADKAIASGFRGPLLDFGEIAVDVLLAATVGSKDSERLVAERLAARTTKVN